MGQYVYEQLIPVTLTEWQSGGLSFSVDSNIFGCKISIFKSDVLVNLKAYEGEIIPAKMINIPVICNPINEELGFYYHGELPVIYYAEPSSAYLRIEYCMGEKFEPKKDDYYGYNNY